jgi:hypothetical protein
MVSVLPNKLPRVEALEVISELEQREIFSVAAIGRTLLWQSRVNYRVEVIEIVLLSAAGNTIQLLANGLPLTPPFPMVANQSYIDPGFFLEAEGLVEIICGGAASVVGYIHWKMAAHGA